MLKNSTSFSLFRTKNPIVVSTPTQVPNGTLNLIAEPEHKSVLKDWKEGSDYFKIESSTVCHDGESVQVKLRKQTADDPKLN